MESHQHHASPNKGDLAYEAFYSAAVGGLVVALLFLVAEVLAGRPLFTPSVLGSVLFFGAEAEAVDAIDYTAVALFTVVHIVGFGILGFVAAGMARFLEERTGGSFVAPAIAIFLILEAAFLVFNFVVAPGAADVIGHGKILLGNGLAAVAMTAFLRAAHGTAQGETAPGEKGSTPSAPPFD